MNSPITSLPEPEDSPIPDLVEKWRKFYNDRQAQESGRVAKSLTKDALEVEEIAESIYRRNYQHWDGQYIELETVAKNQGSFWLIIPEDSSLECFLFPKTQIAAPTQETVQILFQVEGDLNNFSYIEVLEPAQMITYDHQIWKLKSRGKIRLDNTSTESSSPTTEQQEDNDISVPTEEATITFSDADVILIGPQRVGKTTYLATLAYYFDESSPLGIWVEAIDQNAKNLIDEAENILKVRGSFSASNEWRNYTLRLHIPNHLLPLTNRYQGKKKEIKLEVSDYAGEIFQYLDNNPIPDVAKNLIQQCARIDKWLLLLNDWEPEADRHSRRRLEALFQELPEAKRNSLRVAVVMSKCERGELWPGRKEPEEDIFAVHLPKTYSLLRERLFSHSPGRLKFFACSSFGVLGQKQPLPNRENIVEGEHGLAVLRDPDVWEPYGLITPLVWLDTGRDWRWKHI